MAVSLPTSADVRKVRSQATKAVNTQFDIVRTPLLAWIGAGDLAVNKVSDAVAKAREKRIHKNVDIIVANDVSRSDAGFDVDTNAVTIVGPDGEEPVPLLSKPAVAGVILDRVERLLRGRSAAARA